MSSKFFTEVEFELDEDPGAPKKKVEKPSFDIEKLTPIVTEIEEEFKRIAAGTSQLTTYPVNPGAFGMPCQNRLTIFKADPTEENFKAFLELSKQDLGYRVAAHFLTLLKEAQNV